MPPPILSIEDYDEILDALDSEDTNTLLKRFQAFDLEPHYELLDSPRPGGGSNGSNGNNDLITYLDYIISYNLTDVIDVFIDELNLQIDDSVMARCLELENIDTYKYFCRLGYHPSEESLKKAIQKSNCEIVDEILSNDRDLIGCISEDDIECLSNYSLDEQIVETIRVLLNNNVNVNIFKNFACEIIDRKYNNSIDDEEKIVSIEIFDLFRTYGMRIDDL